MDLTGRNVLNEDYYWRSKVDWKLVI